VQAAQIFAAVIPERAILCFTELLIVNSDKYKGQVCITNLDHGIEESIGDDARLHWMH
jgi:hypothetical protein